MIDGRLHSATFDSAEDADDWLILTRARHITGTPSGRRTVADITRLFNVIHEQESAAAAERVYRTLSVLFRSAYQDDVIARVPTRSKRQPPPSPQVPSRRARAGRGSHHLAAVGRMEARCGAVAVGPRRTVRRDRGLTPSDIDLRRGTVQIVRRVSTETVRANKNHRARTLELPGTARPTVERLIVQACDPDPLPDLRDREWPAGPWARRWLVQTATGRHANLSSINKAIKAACRAADVPELGSSHGLRPGRVRGRAFPRIVTLTRRCVDSTPTDPNVSEAQGPAEGSWTCRTGIGEVKGLTFRRVLIYPTGTIVDFLGTGEPLAGRSACGFYVRVTAPSTALRS